MDGKERSRWFCLSFDGEDVEPAIEVGIYEPLVDSLSELLAKRIDHEQLKLDYGFNDYRTNLRDGFGFGGLLNYVRCDGDYAILRIDVSDANKPSTMCASLGLLLSLLSNAYDYKGLDFATDPSERQLMHISARIMPMTMSGTMVGGWMSEVVTERIKKKLGEHALMHAERIERAMFLTWNALATIKIVEEVDGPSRYPRFEAYLREEGSFIFDIPGSAGIATTVDHSSPYPTGHWFGCSNMDSYRQQLTVFAALAAFHDLLEQSS